MRAVVWVSATRTPQATPPLIQLADLIDWDRITAVSAKGFTSGRRRPATSPRLVAGLLYLQHAFDLADEDVVWGWVENPYWQVITGETYLQTEAPIEPSSLTRWRQRLGEAGLEELLAATISAGQRSGTLRQASEKNVIVDTTVIPKPWSTQPIHAYWSAAANIWSRRLENAASNCARTTTAKRHAWPCRSGATPMRANSNA